MTDGGTFLPDDGGSCRSFICSAFVLVGTMTIERSRRVDISNSSLYASIYVGRFITRSKNSCKDGKYPSSKFIECKFRNGLMAKKSTAEISSPKKYGPAPNHLVSRGQKIVAHLCLAALRYPSSCSSIGLSECMYIAAMNGYTVAMMYWLICRYLARFCMSSAVDRRVVVRGWN